MMFKQKEFVRKFIFALFCVLILTLSFILTYYTTLYEEKEIVKDTAEIGISNPEKISDDFDICQTENNMLYFTGSLMFKLLIAFFAGGVVSDGIFIRMGIV